MKVQEEDMEVEKEFVCILNKTSLFALCTPTTSLVHIHHVIGPN